MILRSCLRIDPIFLTSRIHCELFLIAAAKSTLEGFIILHNSTNLFNYLSVTYLDNLNLSNGKLLIKSMFWFIGFTQIFRM